MLQTQRTEPGAFPRQLTSFLGRETEIGQLKKLLSSSALVSLTGPGGTGKTRLAVELAGQISSDFADGARFVDLSVVFEPYLVPVAAARALGMDIDGQHSADSSAFGAGSGSAAAAGTDAEDGEDPGERAARRAALRLADYLSGKQMLLVVDNCEHLNAACAELIEQILQKSPTVSVLATSREPLGIPGEAVYRVPALGFPNNPFSVGVQEVLGYDAPRLFHERAVLARSDFAVTPENAQALARICRRLDGIPLAIELAAAWTGSFGMAEIAGLLDSQFRLFAGTARRVERHQTMQAAIDWSYRLLDEPERILLRRIGVFTGGFSLAAACRVCAGELLASEDVVTHLAGLVRKSLVVCEHSGEAARYRLSEVTRQYCVGKLAEAGEAQEVLTRHLAFFLELAEEASGRFIGPEEVFWLEVCEADKDNFSAALDFSTGQGDAESALRLAAALHYFWWIRGYVFQGRTWLARALAITGDPQPEAKMAAQYAAGWLASRSGDLAAVELYGQQCLKLAGETSSRLWHRRSLFLLSLASVDRSKGTQLLRESLSLARQDADHHQIALALVTTSGGHRDNDRRLKEAAFVCRTLGWKTGMLRTTFDLAVIAVSRCEDSEGKRLLSEAVSQAREVGDVYKLISGLAELSNLAGFQGDSEEQQRLWDEAVDLARRSQDWTFLAELVIRAAWYRNASEARTLLEEARRVGGEWSDRYVCLVLEGLVEEAAGDFVSAEAIGLRTLEDPVWRRLDVDMRQVRREHEPWFGELAYRRGDYDLAYKRWARVSRAPKTGDGAYLRSVIFLAMLAEDRGDDTEARRLLNEAGNQAGKYLDAEAQAKQKLAALALRAGNRSEARTLLGQALSDFPLSLYPMRHMSPGVRHGVELAGQLAAAEGDHQGAAVLMGAADALGARLLAFERYRGNRQQQDYDATLGRLRESMSEAGFQTAWQAGRQMNPKQAVAFALGESVEIPGISQRGPDASLSRPESEGQTMFQQEGDFWSIGDAGRPLRLKDSKGLGYLAILLSNPKHEVPVLELVAAAEGRLRGRPAIGPGRDGLDAVGMGDAGEILDAQARAAYRRRIQDLEEDIAEAEAFNDPERAAHARAELEILVEQLRSAVGIGGRSRRAASADERARVAVTKAIRASIERIGRSLPDLGGYLSRTVKTGAFCSYMPDDADPVTFSVRRDQSRVRTG